MSILAKYYKWRFDKFIKNKHPINRERFLEAIRKSSDYKPEQENTWLFWYRMLDIAQVGKKIYDLITEKK